MTNLAGNENGEKRGIQHKLLFIAALLLPGMGWMVFGWTIFFLPLLVFTHSCKYGWGNTSSQLMIAVPAALAVGFLFQRLELVLLSVAMLPAGYAVAHSAFRGDPPWRAGMRAWLLLAAAFLLLFGLLLYKTEASLFTAISASLANGIDQALQQYRVSDNISGENYLALEQYLIQVKRVAPLILPGILGSLLLFSTWLTLVLGNSLLPQLGVDRPWPGYGGWKLPDILVWVLIGAGIGVLMPEPTLRTISANILILVAVLYSFQGLAVIVFFFHKWNVPRFVRVVLYIMIVLQTFGTMLMIATGVADVWFNFRKLPAGWGDGTASSEG